ncbi:radical SAM/SPASM domain-containing protein [Desulfohalovibrio reitneri]|uniref:radical SAM/SPASM domain-containing protein n=1 Tax=Desulfohalovibrio reitneri TaxID=1307759 RepID=UPI0004A6DB07|nr:radical SAM protein [Desulfohalovibrio reitneri]
MSPKSDIAKADRIQEAAEFPKVLLIDNCNACNLRCSMCDHPNMDKYRKVQLMDMDLYRKLIDEIAVENPDARVWQIFFGDPFMCRDMPERIRYAKEKGLTDVVLNTNGVKMKPEKARAVIEAGLDALYCGIDAATAETYGKIRVGGDFDKAVANVLAYRDILREIGKPGQELYVQFVEDELNEHEVQDFIDFWNAEGVNVKIRPKVSWAGLVNANNLSANEDVDRKACYWLMQTINICADGRVALCSVDVHCRVDCGSVVDRSIKDVWQSTLREYRAMHLEGRFDELPDMCSNCSDWQSGYASFKKTG